MINILVLGSSSFRSYRLTNSLPAIIHNAYLDMLKSHMYKKNTEYVVIISATNWNSYEVFPLLEELAVMFLPVSRLCLKSRFAPIVHHRGRASSGKQRLPRPRRSSLEELETSSLICDQYILPLSFIIKI